MPVMNPPAAAAPPTHQPKCPLQNPHPARSTLELRFSEVLELQAADVAALAGLRRLSGLHLINVSVPAGLDLRPLGPGLPGLRALRLVQNSKVAPLLHSDDALAAIGELASLEELELRGRMCGVGDAGLLALRGLKRLRKLSVGWVPWQSQVSQVRWFMGRLCGGRAGMAVGSRCTVRLRPLAAALAVAGPIPTPQPLHIRPPQASALQLLAGLPSLRSLKLSGAELLLPAALSTGAMPGAGAPGGQPADVMALAAALHNDAPAGVPPPVNAPAPPPAAPLLPPPPQVVGLPALAAPGGAAGGGGNEDGAGDALAPLGLGPPAGAAARATGGGAAPARALYSMASAPLLGAVGAPRGAAARSPAARREAAHAANAHLRAAVGAALAHVDDLKLRFACCGTSIEKVLLALGPQMRARVAGLQWSYAKLGGPLYVKLLASCVNLRCARGAVVGGAWLTPDCPPVPPDCSPPRPAW
jgi:hypothetical protein